jgi:excisionase family DNA binding protein
VANYGKLLTANEVAELLRCHVSTVYDLVKKGRLRAISLTGDLMSDRRGRKGLRISECSLNEFLDTALAPKDINPPRAEPEPPQPLPDPLPLRTRPVKPAGRSGSRVVLPYPGRSR